MRKVCLTIIFSGLLWVAHAETFMGTITDTMCGPRHAMMKSHPDDQCVKMCVKGPYEYALLDGAKVIKLSDQKTPAKYSAKKVRVSGTYNEKTNTIKVSSMEPIDSK